MSDDILIKSKAIPSNPRSKNYPAGTTVVRSGGGTTTITGGGGSSLDVLKVDDMRSLTDRNVFSSLRTLSELMSRIVKSDDSVSELTDENVLSSLRASNQLKAAVDELNASIKSLEDVYLFKTKDDTTAGHLTIEGGATTDLLESSQFTPGTLGAGYLIKYDPITGKSYIEVDEMYVRLKAVFDSLVIKESQHVGGQQIYSCASIECTKVEYIYREALFDSDHKRLRDSEGKYLFALLPSPVYRCYFTSTDGSKTIINKFVPGDLAQCRQFDIKDGTTGNAKNRYYWRYVVAVGENYIDLSVTDCEEGSDIPEAGDKIIQLGNRTDVSRQNAIIMSAYGENAPSKQMLQGINSYSLVDRVILEEGFDSVTKKPYTKNYGRSYVGDREEKSYLKYVPGSGVEARCTIKGISENGKSVYELMPDGTCFFGTTNPTTGKRTGIIQGVDCLINNIRRTGIFAIVEDAIIFEMDPVNKQYSFNGKITATQGEIGSLVIAGGLGFDEEGFYQDDRRIEFSGSLTDGIIASMEPVNIPLAFPMPYDTTSGGFRNVGMYLSSNMDTSEDMWRNKTFVAHGNSEFDGLQILYGSRFKCGLDLETRQFTRVYTSNSQSSSLIGGRYPIHKQIHNTHILQCDNYTGCRLILPEFANFDVTDYARNGGNLMGEFKFIAHPSNKQSIMIQANPNGALEYGEYPGLYNKGNKIAGIMLSPGGSISISLSLTHKVEGTINDTIYYHAIVTNVY